MIPILYEDKGQLFQNNGIGLLTETESCLVTEERNGMFEAEFIYPMTGRYFKYLKNDMYILALPNKKSQPQLFRIYSHSKPMNGKVTYHCEHISYSLNGFPIEKIDISSASAATAIQKLLNGVLIDNDFTCYSDIQTLNSTSLAFVSLRGALGGTDGSILDVWGGEYEFDNFNIKLLKSRGADKGVRIKYGKNLTDITDENNISETYNGIFPYCKYTETSEDGSENKETTVTLTEKIIYSSKATLADSRILIYNFSSEFESGEEMTESALRIKAQNYVNTSGFDVSNHNISVSFVDLTDSIEYEDIKKLEQVNLCDTVTVDYAQLDTYETAKVIKTVFDSLNEKYTEIEIGDTKSNFADTINQQAEIIENVRQEMHIQKITWTQQLEKAIANATALITGQKGGYVVLNPSTNPQEILIMDSPDINKAVNVWRWNSGGLGYSSNGYNGPYSTAVTQDGHIVADFITTGELDGTIIKAGTISADALSVSYKNSVIDTINNTAEQTEINFKAADDAILLSVSGTYATQNSVNASLELKLGKDDNDKLVSMLNASANVINLNSNRLIVNSDNLTIDKYGTLISKNGNFIAGSDSTNANLSNTTLNFVFNNKTIAEFGSTYWSNSTTYGTAVHSEVDSNFISFGHKKYSSDTSYTTVFLLNYGLNPDGNNADIICYGTLALQASATVNNNQSIKFVGSAGTAGLKAATFSWNSGSAEKAIQCDGSFYTTGHLHSNSTLSCNGTKNRIVSTKNYGKRKLYAYETASPMFSDFGNGTIGEDGTSTIELEAIFAECIESDLESYINLTPYSKNAGIYVMFKGAKYFIVAGIPGAKFDWQVTYRQIDYRTERLEAFTDPVISTIQNNESAVITTEPF